MSEKFLYPNTTQVSNYILDNLDIFTEGELKVLLTITRKTVGWNKEVDYIAYSQLMEMTGQSKPTIIAAVNNLLQKELIIRLDSNGEVLTTVPLGYRGQIYYTLNKELVKKIDRLKIFTLTGKKSLPNKTKLYKTQSLSKDNGEVGKKPTCPLLNGSPLKAKYPNGHNECGEYYQSAQDRKGKRFINPPKQFQVLHKILRAGYDFDEMNSAVVQIEKKYGIGNWDFATISNWLEKGASNGHNQHGR